LKKIGGTDKKRIHDNILELENFPNVSNLKKLTDFEPAYRARI
jgi:mRNA interferase RelE/StbE